MVGRQEDPYGRRLRRLQRSIKRERLDAFFVWDRANTRYLTGFQGTASLICLTAAQVFFLTDFRYVNIARASVRHLRVVYSKPPEASHLAGLVSRLRARRIGFEDLVPYRLLKVWQERLSGVEWVEATALLRHLRERKERYELRRIVQAQRIAERVLGRVLAKCRPGVTEIQLAREVLHAIEDEGGDGPAFHPIIAAGPNSALPHARPGDRRLRTGDLVIFDLGVSKEGYVSDMTRTAVVGRAGERQRQIHAIVHKAQQRAIAQVRDGVAAKAVDRAARQWIDGKGFGECFGHGSGHGIGLEVHEAPALSAQSADILRTGMVITIEPGIYVRGWGGVRIEDMVLVKSSGHEVLGRYSRDLIECKGR